MLLLPLLYLPPISYMALVCASGQVYIEACENYIKSTYRNRCEINGAEGMIDLSIPLAGGRDHHQKYTEVHISYSSGWQHRHYMSLLSCYGSVPFFEHYMPHMQPFYERQFIGLYDYNRELFFLLLRLMKLDTHIHFTTEYEKTAPGQTDLRSSFKASSSIDEIIMGEETWSISEVPYISVFNIAEPRLNISSLDLLFNEGPEAKNALVKMISKR